MLSAGPESIIEGTLELRPVTPGMAPTIFGMIEQSRHHLDPWLPWVKYTKEVSDTEKFIQFSIGKANNRQGYTYAIMESADTIPNPDHTGHCKSEASGEDHQLPLDKQSTLVGLISIDFQITLPREQHQSDSQEYNAAVIGYWLGEQFQGNGYVSRAVRAIITYCFADTQIERVVINALPDNTRSIAVALKHGFEKQPEQVQAEFFGEKYMLNVFIMTRERWAERHRE